MYQWLMLIFGFIEIRKVNLNEILNNILFAFKKQSLQAHFLW